MKKMVLCSAVALAVAFGAFGVASAADAKGPTEIVLKSDAGKKPATFPHAKHQAKQKCDDCHKAATFPADKKWDMKKGHAFCQDCHKKASGPMKCTDCHK